MAKPNKTTDRFMPNDDYAFLVTQLRDLHSSDPDDLASIVWTLAESGAVFPAAIKERMNSLLPPASPVWSSDYISQMQVKDNADGSISGFDDILPHVAAELDQVIACFSRYVPAREPIQICQADYNRIMSANKAA